jgi:hypothetical protein
MTQTPTRGGGDLRVASKTNIEEEYRERWKILMGSFAARAGRRVMDARYGA